MQGELSVYIYNTFIFQRKFIFSKQPLLQNLHIVFMFLSRHEHDDLYLLLIFSRHEHAKLFAI